MKRVCVFIDGSNTYFALKRASAPTRVDYYQFALALMEAGNSKEQRELIRVYYYNAVQTVQEGADPEKVKSQREFLDSLERSPFVDVRLGRIISRNGLRTEKGVDVRMATDMVYYAARDFYDLAIIVTEDQDFVPAINLVKEFGKHVELVLSHDSASRDMMRSADRVVWLDEVLKENKGKAMFPSGWEKPERTTVQKPIPATTEEVEVHGNAVPSEEPVPEDNIGNRA